MYVCIYIYVCVYKYIYIYICVYVYMCVFIYIYMYVYINVCMHILATLATGGFSLVTGHGHFLKLTPNMGTPPPPIHTPIVT